MLKWARTIDWLAINTSALALMVFINLLSAFSAQPIENPKKQPQSNAASEPKQIEPGLNWGFGEALFTGVIALYAVRQYTEGRKSSQRQLRAYMFIDAAGCTIADGKVSIKMRFKNFGATPAANVAIRFDFAPANELPELMSIAAKPTATFAPLGTMRIVHAKPIDDFLPVEQRGITLVIGRIDYTDSFGEQRWTNFKMRFIQSAATEIGGLEPTNDGNEYY
jgi:hypothetical protein